MAKKVFIIRGTGFKNLDGSMVTIVEERDDGLIAVVPFGHKDFIPIIIDYRCIQEIDNKKTFTYEFHLAKFVPEGVERIETAVFEIPGALRDVPLETIIEYLNNHLKPLLKLE